MFYNVVVIIIILCGLVGLNYDNTLNYLFSFIFIYLSVYLMKLFQIWILFNTK